MTQVRMLGTGACLPGEPITNERVEELVGPVPDEVLEGIQTKTRHWMIDPDTGEHTDSNTGMAHRAAQDALDNVGLAPEDVDLLVLSSASPEFLLPPPVTKLQELLGIDKCAVLEVRSGCVGAAEALDVARLYLESGRYETAVVVGSEAISPLLFPIYKDADPAKIRMRDRLPAYAFGDGAGAMVLQAAEGDDGGILGSSIASIGAGRKPGMQIIGGGTAAPIHEQVSAKRLVDLRVDVVESGRGTPGVLVAALADLVERSGIAAEDIDLCIIPEGNAPYMTDELREAGLLTPEWLAVEDRVFENLGLVGATGSAAAPLSIDWAWRTGRVSKGDIVMVLAIETSKWMYGGMVLPWTAGPHPSPVEAPPLTASGS